MQKSHLSIKLVAFLLEKIGSSSAVEDRRRQWHAFRLLSANLSKPRFQQAGQALAVTMTCWVWKNILIQMYSLPRYENETIHMYIYDSTVIPLWSWLQERPCELDTLQRDRTNESPCNETLRTRESATRPCKCTIHKPRAVSLTYYSKTEVRKIWGKVQVWR